MAEERKLEHELFIYRSIKCQGEVVWEWEKQEGEREHEKSGDDSLTWP